MSSLPHNLWSFYTQDKPYAHGRTHTHTPTRLYNFVSTLHWLVWTHPPLGIDRKHALSLLNWELDSLPCWDASIQSTAKGCPPLWAPERPPRFCLRFGGAAPHRSSNNEEAPSMACSVTLGRCVFIKVRLSSQSLRKHGGVVSGWIARKTKRAVSREKSNESWSTEERTQNDSRWRRGNPVKSLGFGLERHVDTWAR